MYKKLGGLFTLAALIALIIGNPLHGRIAFASGPNITQTMQDLNGNNIEVDDLLEYTVIIANTTGEDISNPQFNEAIPVGTEYVPNTLKVNDVAVTDAADGDAMQYDATQNTLGFNIQTIPAGSETAINFRVKVIGSPVYLVNSGNPAKAHRLNLKTGAIETTHELTGQQDVYGLALTNDGRYLFGVNSKTDSVFKYDLQEEKLTNIGSIGLGDVGVPCLDFSPGQSLYAGESKKDRTILINQSTGKGTEIARLRVDEKTKLDIQGGDCAFASDGMLYLMSNTSANRTGDLYIADAKTGYGYKVANVSQTQFFTGLALGTDGTLYASSNKDDGLYRLKTDGSEATFLGPFGVAHGGGDLATAAAQKLKIVAVAEYSDDNGNEETVTTTHETVGDPPVDPEGQGTYNLVPELLVDTNGDGVFDDEGATVNGGDTITYMLKYGNVGFDLDTINNLDIDITVPDGVSYKRDSLRALAYNSFPDENRNTGYRVTDLVGDGDSGNYDQGSNKPYFRVKRVKSGQNGFVQFEFFVNNNTSASNIAMNATLTPDGGDPINVNAANPVGDNWGLNSGASTDYSLVFDSSFSMSYELNGQRKIDIATAALKSAIDSTLTEGSTNVNLRVYGSEYANSARESCQDSKKMVNAGPLNKTEINGVLDGLIPNGYTPIDLTLRRVKEDLVNGANAANNQVVTLVSDGQESCGGDVVGAAQDLIQAASAKNIRVSIDTIGFNISDNPVARQELQKIAEISGGSYFDAA